MQNWPLATSGAWAEAERLTQIAMAGGSRQTGISADMARPTGAPAASLLVTMPTGAGMNRSTRFRR